MFPSCTPVPRLAGRRAGGILKSSSVGSTQSRTTAVASTAQLYAATANSVRHFSFSDSTDRKLAVRDLKDGNDILAFFSENADVDMQSLEAMLRGLTRAKDPQAIVEDERFHILLGKIRDKLGSCDAASLTMLIDALAKFRFKAAMLDTLTQEIAGEVKGRENAFSPRLLSQTAMAFSSRQYQDAALIEFVRREALKCGADLEPSHCNGLLEAFRRWGLFDRELTDLIVERMTDEIDRFTSKDIIEGLTVLSNLGLARGFLLRRLAQLSFENLHVFTPKQLAQLMYALSRLRFVVQANVEDVLDHLEDDILEAKLQVSDLSRIVFSLSMLNPVYDNSSLVRKLTGQVLDGHRQQLCYMVHLIDTAWAICRYKSLFDTPLFKARVKDLVERIYALPVSRNRVLLSKMHEVNSSFLHEEWVNVEVRPSKSWVDAAQAAEANSQKKNKTSRLHTDVSNKVRMLFVGAKGRKYLGGLASADGNSGNRTIAEGDFKSSLELGLPIEDEEEVEAYHIVSSDDAKTAAELKAARLEEAKLPKDEPKKNKKKEAKKDKKQAEREAKAGADGAFFEERKAETKVYDGSVQLRNKDVDSCLAFEQNGSAGLFTCDIVDEGTRIAIDIDAPNRPVNRAIKHRILKARGVRVVSINYWRWRQCKSDEDQNELLEKALGPILSAVPRAEILENIQKKKKRAATEASADA